jgi:hypothetical protein
MKKRIIYIASLILCFTVLFIQCSKNEFSNPNAGTLTLKITDAASDDEAIRGIFLTISKIRVNQKPVRNYFPQTVEVSSLRNGKTELLVSKELPAKAYGEITLVLSAFTGKSGNEEGCYVLTKDNTKHNLITDSAQETEITVLKDFELLPGKETVLVIDIDLRKSIIRTKSQNRNYQFVTTEELENALRIVDEKKTGSISGKVEGNNDEDSETYVLLYRHGEFKASTEGSGSGKSKILFANAVSSAKVEPDESYSLPFLEEGGYDVLLAAFKRDNTNEFNFYRFLPTTSRRTGVLLNNVMVKAGMDFKLDIEIYRLK